MGAAAQKPSAWRELSMGSEVLIKRSRASEAGNAPEAKREFDRSFSLFVGLPDAQHWG